jgi:hypothetical protein
MNQIPFELPLEISLPGFATFSLFYVNGKPIYTIDYENEVSELLSHVFSCIQFGLDPDGKPSFDFMFDESDFDDENLRYYHPLTTREKFQDHVMNFLQSCKNECDQQRSFLESCE